MATISEINNAIICFDVPIMKYPLSKTAKDIFSLYPDIQSRYLNLKCEEGRMGWADIQPVKNNLYIAPCYTFKSDSEGFDYKSFDVLVDYLTGTIRDIYNNHLSLYWINIGEGIKDSNQEQIRSIIKKFSNRKKVESIWCD